VASEDDFHDLPSEFEDDDLFLDESIDNNGDMEFLRSAAKNLMTSLAEMEAASTNSNTIDAPHSLLYGDDYVVTIKSRRFTLAFLDYTQFRVEKQRNPDRFRLLASLNKTTNNKKQLNHTQQNEQILTPIHPDFLSTDETKSNKKKRNKRNKKKKNTNDKGIVLIQNY
jgi:transcription termination factor Rho